MGAYLERDRTTTTLLLAAISCVAFVVLMQITSGLTFFGDEWNVILRPGWSLDSLFEPLNEHIFVGPVVVYKVLLELFGMDSTLPFRVVNTLLVITVAWLIFALVRPRLGDAIALVVAVILLFLGPAWEDLLWPAGISFLGAIAGGLGAFLCLERESRRGDIAACALLVVSLAFSSLGLVFAVGAAVDVALRAGRRLERAWIPAVPVLLYAVWYVAYGHEAEGAASWENLLAVPVYVWNAAAAAVASLTGLTGIRGDVLGVNPDWGRPLLLAGVVLAIWTLARHPERRTRALWVFLAAGLAFWASAGLNEVQGREPGASRYQLIGAVFVVLIAAELLRGRRLSDRWLAILGVLAAAVLVSNIGALRAGEQFLRAETDSNLAALAAIDGGARVDRPALRLSARPTRNAVPTADRGGHLLHGRRRLGIARRRSERRRERHRGSAPGCRLPARRRPRARGDSVRRERDHRCAGVLGGHGRSRERNCGGGAPAYGRRDHERCGSRRPAPAAVVAAPTTRSTSARPRRAASSSRSPPTGSPSHGSPSSRDPDRSRSARLQPSTSVRAEEARNDDDRTGGGSWRRPHGLGHRGERRLGRDRGRRARGGRGRRRRSARADRGLTRACGRARQDRVRRARPHSRADRRTRPSSTISPAPTS